MKKWKCRSTKVRRVHKGVQEGKSLPRLLPTHLSPVGTTWSCLDQHFLGNICMALGVEKVPVRRKSKLSSGTRQARTSLALNLVRGNGDEGEN